MDFPKKFKGALAGVMMGIAGAVPAKSPAQDAPGVTPADTPGEDATLVAPTAAEQSAAAYPFFEGEITSFPGTQTHEASKKRGAEKVSREALREIANQDVENFTKVVKSKLYSYDRSTKQFADSEPVKMEDVAPTTERVKHTLLGMRSGVEGQLAGLEKACATECSPQQEAQLDQLRAEAAAMHEMGQSGNYEELQDKARAELNATLQEKVSLSPGDEGYKDEIKKVLGEEMLNNLKQSEAAILNLHGVPNLKGEGHDAQTPQARAASIKQLYGAAETPSLPTKVDAINDKVNELFPEIEVARQHEAEQARKAYEVRMEAMRAGSQEKTGPEVPAPGQEMDR